MKKIYQLCIYTLLGLSSLSCTDSLDSDKYFKDRLKIEDVFTDKTRTEQWLVNAYSYLTGENMEVSTKDNILWCFADDIYPGSGDEYRRFKTGSYAEDWRQSWGQSYKGIRQASIFIQNIDINTKFTEDERADLKAQARFVRAYYYWLLLRKYGPVPLLPDEGLDYTDSYDDIARPRNSYDECAEYIASEMIQAAKDLPLTRGVNQISRPTRGAALSTRARALLYAASPLANPRPEDTEKFTDLVDRSGRKLLSQEYNEVKWAKAAAAARDVMELPGQYNGHCFELSHAAITEGTDGYPKTVPPFKDNDFSEKDWPEGYRNIDPYESYRQVFNGKLSIDANSELIFGRGSNQGVNSLVAMVRYQMPRTTGGGGNVYGMTLKMCDTYCMDNGSDFDRDAFLAKYEASQRFVSADEATAETYPHLKAGVYKEFANREPRFYASVSFNGSLWWLLNNENTTDYKNMTKQQVSYYRGTTTDGFTGTGAFPRTAIGIMKYVHPGDTNRGTEFITRKAEPAIRYAEILLIYAEALNELTQTYNIASWDGSKTYSVSRDINEMKKGIRPIRCRAGMPDYDLETVYKNKDEFRKKLKKERQIEFMGEGQRYFDLRRWKDAPVEESKKVYGYNYMMTEKQKEYFYIPIVINELPTAFSRKLYFWPIQHDELKRNKLLTQNPGWTYND